MLPEDAEAYENCLYNLVCYLCISNKELQDIQDAIDRIVKLNDKSVAAGLFSELMADEDVHSHSKKEEVLKLLQLAFNKVQKANL